MENYRNSKNLNEIVRAFKHIQFGEQDILLWQNVGTERKVTHGTIDIIDYKVNSISIIPQRDEKFAFDKALEIYIHSPFKGTVFKTKDYTLTP